MARVNSPLTGPNDRNKKKFKWFIMSMPIDNYSFDFDCTVQINNLFKTKLTVKSMRWFDIPVDLMNADFTAVHNFILNMRIFFFNSIIHNHEIRSPHQNCHLINKKKIFCFFSVRSNFAYDKHNFKHCLHHTVNFSRFI